jgi:hypothetical protein
MSFRNFNNTQLIDLAIPKKFGGHTTTSYDVEQVLLHCDKMYPIKLSFNTLKEIFDYGFQKLSKVYLDEYQNMLADYDLYTSVNNESVWNEINENFNCYGHVFNLNFILNSSDLDLGTINESFSFTRKDVYKKIEYKKRDRIAQQKNKDCKSFLLKCKNDPTDLKDSIRKSGFRSSRNKTIERKLFFKKPTNKKRMLYNDYKLV